MISDCPFVEKGELILELLISDLGVVDQRVDKVSTKSRQIDGLSMNFILFINTITFEVWGVTHMDF